MYRSHRRKANYHIFVRILLVLFCVAAFLGAATTLMIESFLRPTFLAMAEEKAIHKASIAIDEAVFEYSEHLKYTDLIHYETNNQGDIILMQPNLQVVNQFISSVNRSVNEKLSKLKEEEIQIPIGQAMGLQVLAGLGPKLGAHMLPIGTVKPAEVVDSFETAGINQTRHKIYMQIKAELRIVVPFVEKRIKLESQVPVTEVTIMGKVPDIYVGIDGGVLGQILNKKNSDAMGSEEKK